SYVVEYTINVTDTWEYKTIIIPLDYSGGTWDYTNSTGLNISWALVAGSTFQTTAGAWQTGLFLATSNQVNATDNKANNFRLAKVKFELGQVATPFVAVDYEQELARCQRYYEKSYDPIVNPGTNTAVGLVSLSVSGIANAVHIVKIPVLFKINKRVAPTVLAYSEAGTSDRVDMTGGEKNASYNNAGVGGVEIEGTDDAATTIQTAFHFTAISEL
ncbi:hypothetical protein LCGC14_1619910, partial [marine sediment metagenome]